MIAINVQIVSNASLDLWFTFNIMCMYT